MIQTGCRSGNWIENTHRWEAKNDPWIVSFWLPTLDDLCISIINPLIELNPKNVQKMFCHQNEKNGSIIFFLTGLRVDVLLFSLDTLPPSLTVPVVHHGTSIRKCAKKISSAARHQWWQRGPLLKDLLHLWVPKQSWGSFWKKIP